MTDSIYGLTELEREAMGLSVQLVNKIAAVVSVHDTETGQIPHTAVRDSDLIEIVADIHHIQARITGQAAARAHPTEIRLLGHMLPRTPPGNLT